MKIKRRERQRFTDNDEIRFSARNWLCEIGTAILLVVCLQISLIRRVIKDEYYGIQNGMGLLGSLAKTPESRTEPLPLSTVLILTYAKPKGLESLLRSLVDQRLARFEVVVIDNGCRPGTERVYNNSLASHGAVPSKFLPLCDNPGSAVGNNKGAMMASPDSKYILFLNDDVQLSSPDFIENMILLAESKPNAVSVGCKIVNEAGNELIEAGSIIFKDASAMGYGRGKKEHYIFRPEYSYPRPVDYVSGACLLVEKKVFMGYKHGPDGFGFDHQRFANYYQDTDLQLHIQHDLQKEVWLQPKSIATMVRHEEHGSVGAKDMKKLMDEAAIIFKSKWNYALELYHVSNPFAAGLKGMELDKHLLMAADVRARQTSVANILYIDSHAPFKKRGLGFGRSFDNLSMIAELGHRITLFTNIPEGDERVVEEITDLGIEYYKGDLGSLVSRRAGFYDVVIISRPDTFDMVRASVKSMYLKHPFTLVYDAEALSFHRDELRTKATAVDRIQFPEEHESGLADKNPLWKDGEYFLWKLKRHREISLIKTGDEVITVSDRESKAVSEISSNATNVHTIGHVMDSSTATRRSFQNRQGILLVGAFRDQMHYNGDATWYFLTEVYPLVIKTAKVPISLRIVGSKIPRQLRDAVKTNEIISQHVTFHESPNSTNRFIHESRVLVAPHLYGAGVEYQVLEALSNGLPVVMSRFVFDSFGKIPGCIASDADSMKQCIIDVHGDEGAWTSLQKQGFDFIDETQDRQKVAKEWSKVIDGSLALARHRNRAFMAAEYAYGQAYPTLLRNRTDHGSGFQSFLEHYFLRGEKEGKKYYATNEIWNGLTDDRFEIKEPTEQCEEGERIYLKMYPDVAMKWTGSAFAHYKRVGQNEGRMYVCISTLSAYFEIEDPTDQCPEGELLYFGKYPAVEENWCLSAFDHWQLFGKNEGRPYFCFAKIHNVDLDWSVKTEEMQKVAKISRNGLCDPSPTRKCPEGESIYLKLHPGVARSVANRRIESAFAHWTEMGKNEGRRYFCWRDKEE